MSMSAFTHTRHDDAHAMAHRPHSRMYTSTALEQRSTIDAFHFASEFAGTVRECCSSEIEHPWLDATALKATVSPGVLTPRLF